MYSAEFEEQELYGDGKNHGGGGGKHKGHHSKKQKV